MTEPIEQLVVRLAGEMFDNMVDAELWEARRADLIAFAKACMLHQAKVDAEMVRLLADELRASYDYDSGELAGLESAADAILKAAEGLRG